MSVSHGFTVQRTGDETVDRLQQRIKEALDRVVSTATSSQLVDHTRWVTVGAQNLQNQVRGADVATPSTTLASPAAYQHITGTSTINFIKADNWFDGARVEYYVLSGLTFNHHAVAVGQPTILPMHLLSGAATTKAAGTVIVFRLDREFGFWVQVQ